MRARQNYFTRQRRFPLYMKKKRNWQPVALGLIVLMLIAAGVSYYVAGKRHARSGVLATGQHYTTRQCAYGERKTFRLADSTVVTLNSRTTLYVPEGFPQTSRDIVLDGEAFFNVTQQMDKPLVVKSDKLKITSNGGMVRIRSLEVQSGATMYVLSGEAVVEKTYRSDTEEAPEKLKAGDMILANKDIDLMEKETFQLNEQEDCFNGRLAFDHTPVAAVFRKVEDFYGVEIEFKGGTKMPENVSGRFQDTSLMGMLGDLGDSMKFSYKLKRDKVVVSF